MELPAGFTLACVLARADPRDALVSNLYGALHELPEGATVGTSSLRRQVLLHALRPDLKIEALRGNVDTRLRKLDEGQYAAIVLASSGLIRLGASKRIRQSFEPEQMLPAAGQGALAIEARAERTDLVAALATLAHQDTWLAVAAERAVSRAMGGSCSMPLAAFARFTSTGIERQLRIDTAWGDPSGAIALLTARCEGPAEQQDAAEALGRAAAEQLRAAGAR
jgi:hydroxymethylbilane synthase